MSRPAGEYKVRAELQGSLVELPGPLQANLPASTKLSEQPLLCLSTACGHLQLEYARSSQASCQGCKEKIMKVRWLLLRTVIAGTP